MHIYLSTRVYACTFLYINILTHVIDVCVYYVYINVLLYTYFHMLVSLYKSICIYIYRDFCVCAVIYTHT